MAKTVADVSWEKEIALAVNPPAWRPQDQPEGSFTLARCDA